MIKKHYHVHAGLAGCLPSFSETYSVKKDAQRGMREFKCQCEDSVGHNHRLFTGDAHHGGWYQACHPDAGVDYVELVMCTDQWCAPLED